MKQKTVFFFFYRSDLRISLISTNFSILDISGTLGPLREGIIYANFEGL